MFADDCMVYRKISSEEDSIGTFNKILMPCRCGNGIGSWCSTQKNVKFSTSPTRERKYSLHTTSMVNSSSQQTQQNTLVSILRTTWTGQITSKQSLKKPVESVPSCRETSDPAQGRRRYYAIWPSCARSWSMPVQCGTLTPRITSIDWRWSNIGMHALSLETFITLAAFWRCWPNSSGLGYTPGTQSTILDGNDVSYHTTSGRHTPTSSHRSQWNVTTRTSSTVPCPICPNSVTYLYSAKCQWPLTFQEVEKSGKFLIEGIGYWLIKVSLQMFLKWWYAWQSVSKWEESSRGKDPSPFTISFWCNFGLNSQASWWYLSWPSSRTPSECGTLFLLMLSNVPLLSTSSVRYSTLSSVRRECCFLAAHSLT